MALFLFPTYNLHPFISAELSLGTQVLPFAIASYALGQCVAILQCSFH